MSTLLNQLATALGRRDEVPNQELAQRLAKTKDKQAIAELVGYLHHKDKNIQSDCIKVLDEVAKLEPSLVADYDKELLQLLHHKNNRLVWGAMAVLDNITGLRPKAIYGQLETILKVMDQGSVITKDHGMRILLRLIGHKEYEENCTVLFLDQLKFAATNQLPMYAEEAMTVIPEKHKKTFVHILGQRLPEVEKESKQKRIEKVIKHSSRVL